MIYDTYSGSELTVVESILYYNKNYLGCIQNHKSPFHHKKKVTTRAFDTRVTVLFYYLFPASMSIANSSQVNNYISNLSRATFLHKIEKIHQYIFTAAEQLLKISELINYKFSAHAKFLQQMETYKILKY